MKKLSEKIQETLEHEQFITEHFLTLTKKEDMKKLFAAFERLDEEKNKGVEGTGLGMTITLQLLRAMEKHFTEDEIDKISSENFLRVFSAQN